MFIKFIVFYMKSFNGGYFVDIYKELIRILLYFILLGENDFYIFYKVF